MRLDVFHIVAIFVIESSDMACWLVRQTPDPAQSWFWPWTWSLQFGKTSSIIILPLQSGI